MRVVIVGGNECMECVYQKICRCYGCKARVFTRMRDGLKAHFGQPDLIILFTGTVSHKMIELTLCQAKRCSARVVRCHSSSASALHALLDEHVCPRKGGCPGRAHAAPPPCETPKNLLQ